MSNDKAITNAEAYLLDLCLNHEDYAVKLENEIDIECLSNDPTGRALNDLLAITTKGEWRMSRDILSDYDCPELVRALNDPIFGPDSDSCDRDACFSRCVKTIMLGYLSEQMRLKQDEEQETDDPERKREIMMELLDLDTKVRKYWR